MSTPSCEPVWSKSANLAVVESEGGNRFAILELDGSQPVVLIDTAAAIWRALETPGSVKDVTDRVAAEYGIDRVEILGQIAGFLESLRAQGLADVAAGDVSEAGQRQSLG